MRFTTWQLSIHATMLPRQFRTFPDRWGSSNTPTKPPQCPIQVTGLHGICLTRKSAQIGTFLTLEWQGWCEIFGVCTWTVRYRGSVPPSDSIPPSTKEQTPCWKKGSELQDGTYYVSNLVAENGGISSFAPSHLCRIGHVGVGVSVPYVVEFSVPYVVEFKRESRVA